MIQSVKFWRKSTPFNNNFDAKLLAEDFIAKTCLSFILTAIRPNYGVLSKILEELTKPVCQGYQNVYFIITPSNIYIIHAFQCFMSVDWF